MVGRGWCSCLRRYLLFSSLSSPLSRPTQELWTTQLVPSTSDSYLSQQFKYYSQYAMLWSECSELSETFWWSYQHLGNKNWDIFDCYFFIYKIRQLVDEHQDLPDQHGCLRHHHVHHRGPRHSLHCIQGILVIRSNILLHPASPPGPHSEYSNKF